MRGLAECLKYTYLLLTLQRAKKYIEILEKRNCSKWPTLLSRFCLATWDGLVTFTGYPGKQLIILDDIWPVVGIFKCNLCLISGLFYSLDLQSVVFGLVQSCFHRPVVITAVLMSDKPQGKL